VDIATHAVEFDGTFLQRGFWLYVWDVSLDGTTMLYVGRNGDSSSTNAQSPFNRMGQHLGSADNSSMLRKYMVARALNPVDCRFRLVAFGPILAESPGKDVAEHRLRRDRVAGMDKQLAEDLKAAGYDVVNPVLSTKPLDEELYADVRVAFAAHFEDLARRSDGES
jgi:hypothetical protein